MPLGSAKYTPPHNSRKINISRPDITSGFSVEALMSGSNTNAGRRIANKSNSFRSVSSPRSGFNSKGKLSYFGLPTAPNNIASLAIESESVSSVSGTP